MADGRRLFSGRRLMMLRGANAASALFVRQRSLPTFVGVHFE